MSIFRFKRFSVINERSSMKVNTDGVLLGAAATIKEDTHSVLDIGTGTGTIALMLSQRLADINATYNVVGIDIDAPSIEEASLNFSASPWKDNLSAGLYSLEQYSKAFPQNRFDLIVSNPPYFDNSLTAPEARRNASRHSLVQSESGNWSLGWIDVLEYASSHLTEEGTIAMVLPYDIVKNVIRQGSSYGLFPFRILKIRTTIKKEPKRMIIEFSNQKAENPLEETITLMENGIRTKEYTSLTEGFYL